MRPLTATFTNEAAVGDAATAASSTTAEHAFKTRDFVTTDRPFVVLNTRRSAH